MVLCQEYILQFLLSKWQEFSKCIRSLNCTHFSMEFCNSWSVFRPSSRACLNSCRNLGKNVKWKSKDIFQVTRYISRYGRKLFDYWFVPKASPRMEKGGNPNVFAILDCYINGYLQIIIELNSFTFHEILAYCFCNNSKVRSFVVLKW